MKKFLFLMLVILSFVGYANAESVLIDPQDGPMITTVPVYNNSSYIMGVGSIVIWDIGSSTGDNDNYVNLTTTADTYLVAGIVYPAAIPSGKTGSIATYGIVDCDSVGTAYATAPLCTSTTQGLANVCSSTAEDANRVGFAINAITAGSTEKCFVNTR
jgi:hypothetical protein